MSQQCKKLVHHMLKENIATNGAISLRHTGARQQPLQRTESLWHISPIRVKIKADRQLRSSPAPNRPTMLDGVGPTDGTAMVMAAWPAYIDSINGSPERIALYDLRNWNVADKFLAHLQSWPRKFNATLKTP
jgi:hypothetical protein